ncbi:MAG: glycosyltransferase [Streptosporangiales bacterium]|nr:glycosyltransferase [Streptosporangiales bacterium]
MRLLRARNRRRARGLPASRSTHAVYFLLMHAYGMGGTIRTVHNLAGYLARDHEVTLYSLIRTREEPFFPFPEDITVTPLDDRTEAGRPRGLLGLVSAVLSRIPSVLVHGDDRAYKISSLWTDVQLFRAIRSLRSGVLITTRPALNLIALTLAPPGVITVGQEHMNLGVHKPGLRKAIKRNYGRLDALAVLTDRDRSSYEPLLRSAPTRLVRIPNAVPRLAGGTAQYDSKVVVAAGRLTNQKGFDLLVRAWAQVKPAYPDWTLRIYGSGPWREKLQRMISEHALGENVHLMGRTNHMGEELAKGSIYALSSRFEGFAMVVIEAMSKALPMVAFDCPTGPADVIVAGENGALIKPGDIEGFAAALMEFMDDESKRRRCGMNAQETARTYDLDVVGTQWNELFADLAVPRS